MPLNAQLMSGQPSNRALLRTLSQPTGSPRPSPFMTGPPGAQVEEAAHVASCPRLCSIALTLRGIPCESLPQEPGAPSVSRLSFGAGVTFITGPGWGEWGEAPRLCARVPSSASSLLLAKSGRLSGAGSFGNSNVQTKV